MKQIWKFLVFFSVVLAVTLSFCSAQTVDPLVSSVCLKDGDISEHFYVWGERERELVFPGDSKEWSFLTHQAIIENPEPPNAGLLSFTVTYGYFSNLNDLEEAWKAISYTNHSSSDLGTDPEYSAFDVAKGTPPSYLRFIKNGFIVEIAVGPSRDTSKLDFAERESYFRLVRDKIKNDIESLQTPPVAEFELEIEKTSSSYPFQIMGTVIGTTEYSYQVALNDLNENQEVEIQHAPAGERSFVIEVDALQPGQYQLIVVVHDSLDRIKRFGEEITVPDPQDPPDDPTSQTLPATKDTTIYDRGPHRNEGANPRLLLKKVQGKPAHFLVGFDTANLNTNGLTKATLVLTIDSSQNVTGWGNGRPIRARRVLTEWAEGNGKSLELPNNQQTTGSGSGATWFSPVDANIANNQADSAVTWSGGTSFTAPSTAPTVTIKNHQSGEVSFDVTEDLLLGAPHGWLITRDQDVGSQVAFHSRKAGAALAPRLVLEYGGPLTQHHHPANPLALLASMRTQPITTSQALWSEGQSSLNSLLGGEPSNLRRNTVVTLKPLDRSPEARPGFRQALRQNPMLAAAGKQLVSSFVGPNPITQGIAGTAYRGWLELG